METHAIFIMLKKVNTHSNNDKTINLMTVEQLIFKNEKKNF